MFTFIGTRFSNLYTAFPDETEIKELKFKIWENYIQYFQTLKYGFCLLSRLKGCQLLTLLTPALMSTGAPNKVRGRSVQHLASEIKADGR
jgi:hypothetical protein